MFFLEQSHYTPLYLKCKKECKISFPFNNGINFCILFLNFSTIWKRNLLFQLTMFIKNVSIKGLWLGFWVDLKLNSRLCWRCFYNIAKPIYIYKIYISLFLLTTFLRFNKGVKRNKVFTNYEKKFIILMYYGLKHDS